MMAKGLPAAAPPRSVAPAAPRARAPRGAPPRRRAAAPRPPRSAGGDAVESWLDLAALVTGGGGAGGGRTPYDALADRLGRDVYIDVQGWHLYLKDAKVSPGSPQSLAQALAAGLGRGMRPGGRFAAADAEALLRRVPLRLGGGRAELPLLDALPAACVADLVDICADFQRDM